ncbi:MAG: zinc-binding dehydrogenase [Caldilineales bacterium]
MDSRWQRYREGTAALPDRTLAWPFWGRGLESVGVNGRPVAEPLPRCGEDEILVRVDALGLCASDAKMVRMGGDYPLFFDRDFDADPARLGHEAALTVMAVGERWRAQYYPGLQLGIQPDVYLAGQRAIFGVNLPGAMTQFLVLGPDVLASDHGSCVFPVLSGVSYAEIAVLEPWACVDVAYSATARRLTPKPGGVLWIKGEPGDRTHYEMSRPLESRTVVLSNAPAGLTDWVHSQPVQVIESNGLAETTKLAELTNGAGVDDIILLDPAEASTVSAAVEALAPRGTLNLVSRGRLREPVSVDMNKLHYGHLALLGCTGPDVAQAYGAQRNRSDLRPGGVAWIMGAGGAMGRMHLQRALQMPGGPRAIIATNRGQARLQTLRADFAGMAEACGRELVAFSPTSEPGRLQAEVERLTGGRGCDDIVVIVPNAAAVADALPSLASDGMLVVFAGVAGDSVVELPLHHVSQHRAQFTGTSGSTVADQLRVLEKIQNGTLSAARTVAAVGGMWAMNDGLRAVLEQVYPGKVVIYPQLPDLPLLSLREMEWTLPDVYRQLDPGPTWSARAEQALFEQCWPVQESQ